jgi:hypothetical protein
MDLFFSLVNLLFFIPLITLLHLDFFITAWFPTASFYFSLAIHTTRRLTVHGLRLIRTDSDGL